MPDTTRTVADALLRLTITAGGKRLDMGVPFNAPVVELLPAFARYLGFLDITSAHGGYFLTRVDGTAVDPARTFAAQGIENGDVLALSAGIDAPPVKLYDDVVEAVGDAVGSRNGVWSARDTTNTAVGACVALLAASALTLMLTSANQDSSALTIMVAAAATILTLAAGAIAARLGHVGAGQAFAITASLYGAVTGYLAADAGPQPWRWVIAAGGLALVGLIGLVAVPTRREVCLAPLAIGLFLGGASAFAVATGEVTGPGGAISLNLTGPMAIAAALAGALGNAIPWLGLTSSRVKAAAPLSDAEVTATPPPIDPEQIQASYERGHRVQLHLRMAAAIIVLTATYWLAQAGVTGLTLAGLLFVGIMLSARRTYARTDVLIVMATGILGLAATAFLAAHFHSTWREWLTIALASAAAATAALTILGGKPGTRIGRIADALDLIALVAVLPLGVIVAGLV